MNFSLILQAAGTEDALEVFELAGDVSGSVCEKASLGAVWREHWSGTGWCQEDQVRDYCHPVRIQNAPRLGSSNSISRNIFTAIFTFLCQDVYSKMFIAVLIIIEKG